jgi:hypothetical protein
MRDLPKLSWLNGKTFVQSNGGRKSAPGRKTEHQNAAIDGVDRDIKKEIHTEHPELKAVI